MPDFLENSVIFEIRVIGQIAKVSAIDPVTGTEVSIQAPANIGEYSLQQQALQKLKYVLTKKQAEQANNDDDIIV